MPQNYYIYCIVGLLCLCTTVRALFTGRISTKGGGSRGTNWGRAFYSRDKSPVRYWLSVIAFFITAILAFVLPFVFTSQ